MAHREVHVEGEVLRVLERLESIDDDRFADLDPAQLMSLKEETVSAESGLMKSNGGVRDLADPCRLPQRGPVGESLCDLGEETSLLEPVGGGKGATGEPAATVPAAKALESSLVRGSREPPVPNPVPGSAHPQVEGASGVGAEGRAARSATESGCRSDDAHTPGSASSGPTDHQSPRHNLLDWETSSSGRQPP